MHALPRSLSDRRDHARRQCGRDRRQCLRRLRRLRVGMPDRRGFVFAAERGRADAAVAHAAADLSQGRRQRRHRAVPRRRAWRRHHRRAGAVRRRTAGQRAAGPRQRSDAARTGEYRRGVCLWRQRRRHADARQTEARHCRTSPRGRDVGHHRLRRSASAPAWCGSSRPTIPTSCAPCSMRRPPASRRQSRPASCRAAPSAACSKPRFANCISPRPRRSMSCRLRRARRSAASISNVEGCTLCHACVTACPTHALSDNPDRAMLRFTESLCVQCGLCQSTCPEKVITLEPRLDFKAWNAPLTRAEGRRAVPLHRLRQAVRHQELDRPRAGKTRREALDVPGRQRQTSRRHQDVRGLPRRSRGQRKF